MLGNSIKYSTSDNKSFDGYLVKPEGDGPFPGIVILTAIFGVDEGIIKLSDEWAKDGFIVSVPDIFWRVHPGPLPLSEHEAARARMDKFDVEQGVIDIEDIVLDLRNRAECNGKVGMLGFCFGGRYVHLAAARLDIDAGAAFHGTAIGKNLDETGKISCPMSLHFGDKDPVVPMDEVNAIKDAYANNKNADIGVYEGADHSFSMPWHPSYHEGAAKASRQAVLECFQAM